jgi:hypothetical protein
MDISKTGEHRGGSPLMVSNDDGAYQKYGDAYSGQKNYDKIPVNRILKPFR